MNSQTGVLLAIGAFVALIVTVAAVDQYLLDEHPPTEVDGLIWRVENAFNRIQDLEATLQVTSEYQPAENVRMKVRYIKGPPSLLSMRYVPPQDADEELFIAAVRDETFTVQNDQLFHYLPSEDIVVSKRWPGLPLVSVGLGIFDVGQIRADWLAGKTNVRILQNIAGFSGFSFAPRITGFDSFSQPPNATEDVFSGLDLPSQTYTLCLSLCPIEAEERPMISLRIAQTIGLENQGTLPSSYILEVRDAATANLVRMVWIDRDTYLIQKVIVFENGQRSATLLVQLLTVDQGLTESEVIPPPQIGVENVRG